MDRPHIIDLNKDREHLHSVFEKIAEGNTILFLGAGASVTNKIYLSSHIINYYEDKVGKNYNINDITKFLDVLEARSTFDRRKFDDMVADLLKNLKTSDHHKIIASIPWKQILTTNYDLLLEQAYDDNRGTSNHIMDIVPVKSLKEYNSYYEANNEIRYIKLNGCLSDKGEYPFIFSSDDFKRAKKFHRNVLKKLKNPSHKINFLSAGYSFSDSFAFRFFDDFDSFSFSERRWIYNIDPFVDDELLPYFENKKIHVIKLTCNDFFKLYSEWESENINLKNRLFSKRTIRPTKNNTAKLTAKLHYNLRFALKQIDDSYEGSFTSKTDFYKGAEPDYGVILRNYDIVRSELLDKIETLVQNSITQNQIIPIIFLTGSFGIGKSTFTYRTIHSLLNKDEYNAIAFEIIDFDRLRFNDIAEVIENVSNSTIIFHCNLVEKDTIFKAVLSLRTALSSHQFNKNILFLLSIRENILEKHKKNRDIKNSTVIEINSKLNRDEISELVENLKQCNLINYRGEKEKNEFVNEIILRYNSDQFISLVDLITDGKHIEDLRDAYAELSNDCQKAFLFTALLHRYKIYMPSSILRSLISRDWDEFIENVVNVEGKGILLQEYYDAKGVEPDLYFRTKHPIIAELIIKDEITSLSKQFNFYKKIFTNIIGGEKNIRLATDLLKAMRMSEAFSKEQINKLFDVANNNLSDEPHFLLQYATNLQYRGKESDLIRAYDILIYAESLLEKRNHRFIHRRGVICFNLAKLHYKKENELVVTIRHLRDAKELLRVKQIYDPFSHYSYNDLIKCLTWELNSVELGDEDEARLKIEIEDLIETALSRLVDGLNKIIELQNKYNIEVRKDKNDEEYEEELLSQYENPVLRPYMCVLLHNFYERQKQHERCQDFIYEMEGYLDNYEVLIFIFKYYGQNLHIPDTRVKFFDLVRRNEILENKQPLRYHYYSYVNEAYNWNFNAAFGHLRMMGEKYMHINPEYQQYWREEESGEPKIFEGKIVPYKNRYKFKSREIPRNVNFHNVNDVTMKSGKEVSCRLKFHLFGIVAEVIN